jgi:hypothetical protein
MQRTVRILLPLLIVLATSQVAAALDTARVTEGCIPLVLLAKADFDGDRKEDKLLGAATLSPHAFRSLLVKSAGGKTMLDITDAGYYYIAKVADIGAPNPIIIAGTPFGSRWANLEAWMYVTGQGFQQLWWDSSFKQVGLIEGIDTKKGQIQLVTPTGNKTYRYINGRLQSETP